MGEILKDMMRKGTGAKMIRTKLQEYVDALKKEHGEGLILPQKDEATKSSGPKAVTNAKTKLNNSANTVNMKNLELGSKIEVEDIDLQCDFKCTGMELFNALTQPEMMQIFTQNPVKMNGDAKSGTNSLFWMEVSKALTSKSHLIPKSS